VADADENELYAALDWLLERQDAIEQRLAKRHRADGARVLYDLSSSYVEGSHCPHRYHAQRQAAHCTGTDQRDSDVARRFPDESPKKLRDSDT
jgi:uncharacterized membrane protein YccC